MIFPVYSILSVVINANFFVFVYLVYHVLCCIMQLLSNYLDLLIHLLITDSDTS